MKRSQCNIVFPISADISRICVSIRNISQYPTCSKARKKSSKGDPRDDAFFRSAGLPLTLSPISLRLVLSAALDLAHTYFGACFTCVVRVVTCNAIYHMYMPMSCI